MTFKACIRNAHEAGEITLEERQSLEKRFDALYRQLQSRGAAKDALAAELEAEAAEKKRRALLTESVRKERVQEIMNYRDARGRQDMADGLQFQLEHAGQARFQDVMTLSASIERLTISGIEEMLNKYRKGWFTGDLRRHRGQIAVSMDDMGRAILGEAVQDEKAKVFAQAVSKAFEDLRQRRNAAGGATGKLDYGYLPVIHDGERLAGIDYDAWRKDFLEYADVSRSKHPLTGQALTDVDIEDALRATFERAKTDGWIDREASGAAFGGGALFSRRTEHRFWHPKSYDAWKKYQQKYGQGDVYASIMGHISSLSREIALMERLGPNPPVMMEYLKQIVTKAAATMETVAQTRARQMARLEELSSGLARPSQAVAEARGRIGEILAEIDDIRGADGMVLKRGAEQRTERERLRYEQLQGALVSETKKLERALKDEKLDKATAADFRDALDDIVDPVAGIPEHRNPKARTAAKLERIDALFAHVTGSINSPVNAELAHGMAIARTWVATTSLGFTPLMQIGDQATQMVRRMFIGMPVSNQLWSVLKGFTPTMRREALRAGLGHDTVMRTVYRQAQYVGKLQRARAIADLISDRQHTFSLLSPMTEATKVGFGIDFMGWMADHAGSAWKELPDAMQRMLDRHGFEARSWDRLRASRIYEPAAGSAGLLRPAEVAEGAGRDLAERYLAMLLRERAHTTIEGMMRTRAMWLGQSKPGTLLGEVLRSTLLLKSFPITFTTLLVSTVFREMAGGSPARGALYAGGVLVSMTLMAAVSIQLYELFYGRDFRNMKDPKFWGSAMLRGGGLGIYGDFFFNDVNRFGGSLSATTAGPLASRIDNLRRLTTGNLLQGAAGEKTNSGREVSEFVRQNTPFGGIWYLRLAWDRLLVDQLQAQIDPEASRAFRRKQQQRKHDYGNEFWWAPGETSPRRGPRADGMLGR